MSSVRTCDCGALVYVLATTEAGLVWLDPVTHPAGRWQPQPDGVTARRVAGGGHREHVCDRLPDGQDALFGNAPEFGYPQPSTGMSTVDDQHRECR